jgi:hypothetical protein
MFRSFYVEAKLLIACKDPTKIPPQRIVEMNQERYMLNLEVAGNMDVSQGGNGPDNNPDVEVGLVGTTDNNLGMDGNVSDAPSTISSCPCPASGSHGNVHVVNKTLCNDECKNDTNVPVMEIRNPSPTRSLPGILNHEDLDDNVWDLVDPQMEPMHIDVNEIEANVCSHLGEKSVNLSYCSQFLNSLDEDDSDGDEQDLEVATQDNHVECLDKEICDRLSGAKRTLLPFLDEV